LDDLLGDDRAGSEFVLIRAQFSECANAFEGVGLTHVQKLQSQLQLRIKVGRCERLHLSCFSRNEVDEILYIRLCRVVLECDSVRNGLLLLALSVYFNGRIELKRADAREIELLL